ncbi:MAG: DMT family transporter [Jatrophihabitantaceae bacterium]
MAAVSLALAAVAAGCNATSSVLQRKANREDSPDLPFGLRLLVDLVRRPIWLLGGLAMLASFLLQAAALGLGTLSSVEPVLALELPLTLMIGSAVFHHPLRVRDWMSAAALGAGLGMFIGALSPSGGDAAQIRPAVAALASGGTVVGVVALALFAHFGPARSRAALYGAAAGSGFGLTASMIKVSVSKLSTDGAAGLFSAWETYGVAVAGVGSLVLVQAALHFGTLIAVQPGLTLMDPLVSLLWGTVVLGETTRTGPILLVAAAGAAVIAVAVVVLARSSAAADNAESGRETCSAAAVTEGTA